MTKMHLAMAAAGVALALALGGQPASATPIAAGAALSRPEASLVQVQWRRPRRVCRVDVIRRHTPRGVVVTKVRRCR